MFLAPGLRVWVLGTWGIFAISCHAPQTPTLQTLTQKPQPSIHKPVCFVSVIIINVHSSRTQPLGSDIGLI